MSTWAETKEEADCELEELAKRKGWKKVDPDA